MKRDINKIHKKISSLHERDDKREGIFRQSIKYIDKKAEQTGFINFVSPLYCSHF